ncbi:MAG: hypothetical protein U0807_14260 [Candidatus Binatia bacterium]
MSRLPRRLLVAFACALLVTTTAVRAEQPPTPVVEFTDGRLTVSADGAPFRTVLDAVARATGAEIRGQVNDAPLHLRFEKLPLRDGLDRLLGAHNFALTYTEAGRLRAIDLLGGPLAPPAPTGPSVAAEASAPVDPHPWPPTDEVKQQAEALMRYINSDDPMPVSGRLAQALGTRRASFKQIIGTGLRQDDPRVRAQATRVSWNHLRATPDSRKAFVSVMNSFDDPVLARGIRNLGGDHADELMRAIVRYEAGSDLHTKATSVLRELRSLPPPADASAGATGEPGA